jgi:hypothetical protein
MRSKLRKNNCKKSEILFLFSVLMKEFKYISALAEEQKELRRNDDVIAYGSVCRDVKVHDLPVFFLNRFISGSRSRRRKRKIPLVLIFPAL